MLQVIVGAEEPTVLLNVMGTEVKVEAVAMELDPAMPRKLLDAMSEGPSSPYNV